MAIAPEAGAVRVQPQALVSDEVLRSAFDRSPTGMTVASIEGQWLWVNDAFCRLVGYPRTTLLQISAREVTHAEDSVADRQFLADALAGDRDILQREKRYIRPDGSVVWVRVRVEVIRDEAGAVSYFVSHVQDVSERRRAQGLQAESERTLRSVIDNTPAMICVKGRDHRYRLVNREFEQAFGMSSRWIVGRTDAEIMPPSTLADAHAKELEVIQSGRASQEEQTTVSDGREQVLLITRFPLAGENGVIDSVCVATTDITMHRESERVKRERLDCSALIYTALAEGRFVLYGQPIVPLRSVKPATAELLIRMRADHSDTELVPPAAFLPAAEGFGLISLIDRWAVDQAIVLSTAGHRVAVNISARTVSDRLEVDRIEAALLAGKAPPANIVFEITETAVADDLEAAHSFARRLHALGYAIALDDFGVGHGSFTYLRHLPVDYLKIDMQFVRDLLTDEEDRQVVQAIVGVARQFGIETIAEGVEDETTLETLRGMGVDYAQGHVTGRPMPLDECWRSVTSLPGPDIPQP